MTEQGTADHLQPIFATLGRTDREETCTVLNLFGREIHKVFTNKGHLDNAKAYVNLWNEHFDREWLSVRETSASIMQTFCRALLGVGVTQVRIDAAMDKMKTDAGS